MSLERFNDKISTTGVYMPIRGWTYICNVTDDLTFIQNYIQKHNVINNLKF